MGASSPRLLRQRRKDASLFVLAAPSGFYSPPRAAPPKTSPPSRPAIANACEQAGRDPSEVTLLAVSKNHPAESVAEAVRLGLTIFGENRVQEAKAESPLSPGRARWHFIGHLQSNKARDAVALFETIESVDSLALAAELQKQAGKAGQDGEDPAGSQCGRRIVEVRLEPGSTARRIHAAQATCPASNYMG
jgi:alkanesulfonate monooxygenase SsuD/methylene tetrahydromethanopterin reductase-like flavin-dependent oxidoreductase (luciferase family)